MKLTEEEKRIVEMVIDNKKNFEMAKSLFMSRSTFERKLTEIYQKFKIQGNKKRTAFIIQVLKMQSEGLF